MLFRSQDAALYVEGHMGSFGLYRQLWAHRDRPVAIDDLDRLYSRSDCLRLLKPLCNSGPVKRITWYSNATRHSPDVPESFVTRSRVILIANEWHTLNDNVRALEDRAIILSFEPTNLAVHQRVGSWFDDQEVYRLIETILPVAPAVSMRHYVKARALKRAGIADWAMGTMQMVLADAHLAAVAWLVSDTSFDSEAARVERFTQLTGRSRPTYFRLKNRLRATG